MLPKLIVPSIFASLACAAIIMFLDIPKSSAAVALIFAFPALLLTYMFKFGTQTAQKPANAMLFEDRELTVELGGFRQTVAGGITSYVPWQFITKIEDRFGFFLLYFGAGQFFMVPHRVLEPELDQRLQMFFYQKGLLKPKAR